MFGWQNEELGSASGLSLLFKTGGVWRTGSVTETRSIVLTRWRAVSVPLSSSPGCTRHFVGRNMTESEGRVSGPILGFDSLAMRGRTSTGRIYELRGITGCDSDAEYVWHRWKQLHGLEDSTKIVDISEELSSSGEQK